MNEHHIRAILEGNAGWPGSMIKGALWPAGKLYGLAMTLRREAYRRGIFASTKVPLPVISVGNLTAGGTGKTPFTLLVARILLGMGRRPAILLRGYRQSAAGHSDEAELYRRELPDVQVVTGADRRISAAAALRGGADVVILDDGFQHLRLRRDLDIVLVDATSPWGGGNTFPGGLLREPPAVLMHAGIVVVTRADQAVAANLPAIKRRLAALAPKALLLAARHAPKRLTRLDGPELPLASLKGRRVVALAGIARPEAFLRTLADLGAEVVGQVFVDDHANFSESALTRCFSLARQREALVVTTEKDRARRIWAASPVKTADDTKGSPLGPSDLAPDALSGDGAPCAGHPGEVWVLGIEMRVDAPDRLEEVLARF